MINFDSFYQLLIPYRNCITVHVGINIVQNDSFEKNESKLGNKAFRLCCSFGLRMKVEMEMMNILFVFVFIINKK